MLAAVVLAAGEGRRFAGPEHKLRVPVDGVPLLRRAVDAAVAAGIGPVLVVTGAEDVDDLLPAGVTRLDNPRWGDGQATSLAAALDVARSTAWEAVVVGLGDMPGVSASAWRDVADREGAVVIANYGGRRRPPVKLHRSVWDDLPTTGDEGARVLMRERPDLVVDVEVAGSPLDVDTAADLTGPSDLPG